MHDCVTALKPQILEIVETARDEEIAVRKAKKKKEEEEEKEKQERKLAEKAKEAPLSVLEENSSENKPSDESTTESQNINVDAAFASSTPNDTSVNEALASVTSRATSAAADLAAAITSQLRESTAR